MHKKALPELLAPQGYGHEVLGPGGAVGLASGTVAWLGPDVAAAVMVLA